MKQTPQDSSWQNQILSWITVTPNQNLQQAIIQVILVIWIILTMAYAIGYQLVSTETPVTVLWRLVLSIILYSISRTKYYQVVTVSVILLLLFQPLLVFVPFVTIHAPALIFGASIFALPLSLFLLNGNTRRFFSVLGVIFVILNLIIGSTQLGLFSPLDLLSISMIFVGIGLCTPFLKFNDALFKTNKDISNPTEEDLLARLPDLVMIILNNQITYINPAGVRLIGAVSSDDIVGQPLSKFIPESKQETPSSDIFSVRIGTMNEWNVQSNTDLYRLNNESIRINMTMTFLDPSNTQAVILTAKPSLHAVSASDVIVESTDVLLSIQRDGKNLYMNSEFERLTGHSRAEVYSSDKLRFQFIYEDDVPNVSKWLEDIYANVNTRNHIEYRVIRKAADPVWVRSTYCIVRYLGKPAYLITTVNIDDYYERTPSFDLISASPVAYIIAKEVDGTVLIVDGKLTGIDNKLSLQSLNGQPLNQLLQQFPESLTDVFDHLSESESEYTQADELSYDDGQSVIVEWTATRLDHSLGDYIIVLRSIEDEVALKTEISHFQFIFNMMNDYAYMLKILPDDTYQFEWVSHAFKAITGYDPEIDATQDILDALYHPDDRAKMVKHFETLRNGQSHVQEYRLQTKAGATRYMREYAYSMSENEQPAVIYASVSDTTSNYIAEQTLKNYAMQQGVIAEVGMVAVSNQLDTDEFARQALNILVQIMEVPFCTLIELKEDEPAQFSLHTVIGHGWHSHIEPNPNNKSSYLGYILHQNDAVLVNDWSIEKRFTRPNVILKNNLQSTLGVVVPMQDRPFGVLNLHSMALNHFSPDNINTVQMVANIIGTYIQQKRIREAEYEHHMVAQALGDIAALLNSATELDDILLIILNFVAQIVPVVDSSNIMLHNLEQQTATIVIRHNVNTDIPPAPSGQEFPLEELPLFTEMIETGNPVVINDVTKDARWHVSDDTPWIQSYMAAPIFAGDVNLGVINLDSRRRNAFNQDHVEQLEVFMNHASIAIQNAQQAEKLKREVESQTHKLKAERAQLQAVFQATGEGIFYSEDATMLFVNEKLCEIMGYERYELLGQSSVIFRPDDLDEQELRVRDRIIEEIKTKGIAHAEIRFKRKNGEIFTGAITASHVSVEDDDKRISVTIIRDISEAIKLEEQRNSFISYAAHELRNPITALNTRIYIMRQKEDKNMTINGQDIDKFDQIVQKMNLLVSGLLDFSRYQSGRIPLTFESVIVHKVLGDVRTIQQPEAEKENQTLIFDMPEEPVTMIGDELRLYQIVTNLVSNALHYTPANGTIQVSLAYTDDEKQMIIIKVMDNGIGIPKDKQINLFQPFYQVDNEHMESGTGLGLSITKELVEAHHGTISVESEPGEGSTFIVILPVNGEPLN